MPKEETDCDWLSASMEGGQSAPAAAADTTMQDAPPQPQPAQAAAVVSPAGQAKVMAGIGSDPRLHDHSQ